MNRINLRRTTTFAVVLAGLLSVPAASAFAQQQDSSQKPTGDPVADAARKARDDKKKEAKPKKVYTNEDMGGLPANAVSTLGTDSSAASSSSNAPAEGTDNQAGAKAKEPGKGAAAADADKDPEKVWRKRFQEAHAKLAQLEKELEILQREQGKAELQYYPDPQKAMEQGYTRKDINENDAKIAAKKQEIDQQKQRISDMEDELRKSGGDPGWASQ